MLLALKELSVGALIGFMFGVPFWAIQAVGELIDEQRGVTNEEATDPTTRSQASSLSIFLAHQRHHHLRRCGRPADPGRHAVRQLRHLADRKLPPKLTLDSALSEAEALDHVLRFALLVAAPVIALFLLIDLSIMLIGRSAPHLNAFDLPPTVKNVVFVVFMGIYVTYLIDYMRGELAVTHGIRAQLERFLQ